MAIDRRRGRELRPLRHDEELGTKDQSVDRHIYLIFNHEPESQANDPMGSSADFIAAWRRFVQVFRAEGTRNVTWTWTMTDWAFETSDERAASNWYPDDVVDAIGATVQLR